MKRYRDRSPGYHRPHVCISPGFPRGVRFLGDPSPCALRLAPAPAGASAPEEHARGYFVPHSRLPLDVGPRSPPGFCGNASGSPARRPAPSLVPLDQANNPSRLVLADDGSHAGSSPTHIQLRSTGFPVGFRVTAFYTRFTRLRTSRTRGAYAVTPASGGQELHLHGSEVLKDQCLEPSSPGARRFRGNESHMKHQVRR